MSKNLDGIQLSQSFAGVKILVVDDNLINQKVASKTLTKQGAEVNVANHGREAIAMMESQHYNIILMDLQMPEMNGFETTGFIRNNMQAPLNKIPIIAMTATALVSEKAKCLASGMNDYISKPFHAKDLYEKIRLQLS